MKACPACKRRIFTQNDLLGSNINGWVKCPACDHVARLDQTSRFLVTAVLPLALFLTLLYGNIFFSGYLFAYSTIFIFAGWRLLSAAALPLLALETAPGGFYLNRRQSIVTLVIMIVSAVALDGLLSYRSAADKADDATAAQRVNARSK